MTRPIILLTRPLAQSRRFADQLREALGDLAIEISPALAISRFAPAIPDRAYGGLVFTSENAVLAAADILTSHPGLMRLPAFCVGRQTAETARKAGFDAVALGGDAKAMIQALGALGPQAPLLYLHGEEADLGPWKSLTNGGIETVFSSCYRQVSCPLSTGALAILQGKTPVILPVFSARSAGYLADQGPINAPVAVVAISQAVGSACLALASERLVVAEKPDAMSMIAAIGGILRQWQP